MPGPQALRCSSRAVAGAVAAVAQLGEAGGDSGDSAEDALDRVGAVGSGRCGAWVQSQPLLRLADQFRQVGLIADLKAPFGQDDLGGAFDQLLRAPDGQCGVVGDRALDAVERG